MGQNTKGVRGKQEKQTSKVVYEIILILRKNFFYANRRGQKLYNSETLLSSIPYRKSLSDVFLVFEISITCAFDWE